MRDGIAESRHLICVRSTSRRAKRGSIGFANASAHAMENPVLRDGRIPAESRERDSQGALRRDGNSGEPSP